MSKMAQQGSFELVEDAFGSIEALIADARGNATIIADKTRTRFAADYLRLAAQKSAALAELVEAVSKANVRQADRATKRLREIDRAVSKFLDVVSADGGRILREHGGQAIKLEGDDAAEFVNAVRTGRELPTHLLPQGKALVDASPHDADGAAGDVRSGPDDDKEGPSHSDIRQDTTIMMEVMAYQAWTEMTDLAYKKDGIVGVIHASLEAIKTVDECSSEAAEVAPNGENMQRAIVARFLGMEYLPDVSKALREIPDGPYYWEDAEGRPVDFPQPGQPLRTAAETRNIAQRAIEHFEIYKAAEGRVLPGFWKGLVR